MGRTYGSELQGDESRFPDGDYLRVSTSVQCGRFQAMFMLVGKTKWDSAGYISEGSVHDSNFY